jgi:hypothetical protein
VAHKAIKQTRLFHNNKKHISHLLHSAELLTSNRHDALENTSCPYQCVIVNGSAVSKEALISYTLLLDSLLIAFYKAIN